jgi:hypothetical protein
VNQLTSVSSVVEDPGSSSGEGARRQRHNGPDRTIERETAMNEFGEVLRWIALVMLSCVVPIGIFVGRNNIRAFRREIVRDLERLFSFARLPNGAPLIIPSFELVKYKYDPESNPNRDLRGQSSQFYLLFIAGIHLCGAECARLSSGIYARCSAVTELFRFPGRASR